MISKIIQYTIHTHTHTHTHTRIHKYTSTHSHKHIHTLTYNHACIHRYLSSDELDFSGLRLDLYVQGYDLRGFPAGSTHLE